VSGRIREPPWGREASPPPPPALEGPGCLRTAQGLHPGDTPPDPASGPALLEAASAPCAGAHRAKLASNGEKSYCHRRTSKKKAFFFFLEKGKCLTFLLCKIKTTNLWSDTRCLISLKRGKMKCNFSAAFGGERVYEENFKSPKICCCYGGLPHSSPLFFL